MSSCAEMPGEQEDEEAFLEGITNPSGPSPPQLALKVKLLTAHAWSPALLIRPGQHTAGLQNSAALACMPTLPGIVSWYGVLLHAQPPSAPVAIMLQ